MKYEQVTWAAPDGKAVLDKPMHAETGYIRVLSPPSTPAEEVKIEMCVADPTGITQILQGILCSYFLSFLKLFFAFQGFYLCHHFASRCQTEVLFCNRDSF